MAVEYPNDKENLTLRILANATQGPQKIPLTYFQIYFQQGGGAEHPILGDLQLLVNSINCQWDVKVRGTNLVSGFLTMKLNELQNANNTPNP